MKNNYFIDTIELTYHTTFEYITEKLGTVPKKCIKKVNFIIRLHLKLKSRV